MLQLLGIDDRADRLDDAVRNVDRDDIDQTLGRVEEHRARWAVDRAPVAGQATLRPRGVAAPQQRGPILASDDRLRPGRDVTAAVAVDDDVRREQLDEAIHVALADGVEEPRREPVSLLAR